MTTETNAEWLKKISAYQQHGFPLPDADFERLIQQAELSEKRNERYRVWYEGAKKALGEREVFRHENVRLRELVKLLKLHAVHCDADGRTIQPHEIIDVINEFTAGETNGQRKA